MKENAFYLQKSRIATVAYQETIVRYLLPMVKCDEIRHYAIFCQFFGIEFSSKDGVWFSVQMMAYNAAGML